MKEGQNPKPVNLCTLVNDKLEGWQDSDADKKAMPEEDGDGEEEGGEGKEHQNYADKEFDIAKQNQPSTGMDVDDKLEKIDDPEET